METESWDQVVRDNRDYVYRVACNLSGDMHEAEDLTQDTFLKAYEHRDGFRGDSSVRTWLCKIAVNTYLTSRRKNGRVQPVGSGVESATDFLESPEYLVVQGEFLQCIHFFLQYRCKPADRALLVMRDLNGQSYEDMARTLGISVGAVKVRLHRARRAFRDLLISSGCAAIVPGGRCVCKEAMGL